MSHYLLLTHFIFLALVVCVQRDVTSVVKWSRRLYYDIRLCLLSDLSLRAQVRKQVSVRPASYIGLCRLQGSLLIIIIINIKACSARGDCQTKL